jgi:hypothetical protein
MVIRIALPVSLVPKELIISLPTSAPPSLHAKLALLDKLLLLVLPIARIVLRANGAHLTPALTVPLVSRVLIILLPLSVRAQPLPALTAASVSTPRLQVQLIARPALLVSMVLPLLKPLLPQPALIALLARTALLVLPLALLALMVTIPLQLEPLFVTRVSVALKEMVLANLLLLALLVSRVTLPLLVAPPAFIASKALGLPMARRLAQTVRLVRLV